MKFHEKLSLLMDITKTTNQELALYSCLDSSYISRLKNGNRNPVKEASYLQSFSVFFAKRIKTQKQEELLKKLLELDSAPPFSQDFLNTTLCLWLTEDFFIGSDFNQESVPSSMGGPCHAKDADPQSSCSIYYGTKGKRLAALNFMGRIAESSSPQTLLFFSDEDMTWMTEDPVFASQWAQLMKKILLKGHRIRIIHDLNRGLDEIFSAIGSWIPLYMTGSIEPYYYPRIRDGVYKRSLFIAPGLCAVTSSSVGNMVNPTEETATFFFTEKKAIIALEKEFNSYLALCLPLMNVFTPERNPSYLDLLADFEKISGNTIIKTKHLSSLSMPEAALVPILKKNPQKNEKKLLAFQQFRMNCLEKNLKTSSVREIFSLPSPDALSRGEVLIDYSLGLAENAVCYSKEEYCLHLEHVLYLLKNYKNYHICIEKESYDLGYSVAAKENSNVMISKNKPPLVFLSVSGNSLAVGFWDFLLKLSQKNELKKERAIEEVEKALAAYQN